ncbi:unnamed protein product, partial [Ectocarpus sp. 12 AP-2014]
MDPGRRTFRDARWSKPREGCLRAFECNQRGHVRSKSHTRQRRGKGKSSWFRRGENKSDSRQQDTDRQRRDAEGGPSRVYSSTSSATAAYVVLAVSFPYAMYAHFPFT